MIDKADPQMVHIKLVTGERLDMDETKPYAAAAILAMADMMKNLDREYICVVNLNQRNRPLNYSIASIGDINHAISSPDSLFKTALLSNASRIIMLHNHPSGETSPSPEDVQSTRKMNMAGQIMKVPLMDHVIIGGENGNLTSMRSYMPEIFTAPELNDDYYRAIAEKNMEIWDQYGR